MLSDQNTSLNHPTVADESTSLVKTDILDQTIGIVSIDSPPMNTTSQAVRAGLLKSLTDLITDDTIKSIVIMCEGRSFIAGAEVSEFGKPPIAPTLAEVIHVIEGSTKPVIASIHGFALGAGLELALSCDYRIAVQGAKLGLPEVHLGILPGAGGTQRTPRLIGVEKALEMILSGRHVPASEALEIGLIDELVTVDDAKHAGVTFASKVIDQKLPLRKVRDMTNHIEGKDFQVVFDNTLDTLKKTSGNLFSPFKIVEAVKAATELPFEQALKRERELFMQCMDSPQREGLIHAFFAERKVSKTPESATSSPREINHVGIIGGGTMGTGISVALLTAGIEVTLVEQDAESAERTRAKISKIFDRSIEKGRITEEKRDALMNNHFKTATDYSSLSKADLVIEAVFENMDLKKTIFLELDGILRPGAILASNTSYLDLDELAAQTNRPSDIIGLHFFSPAHIMKLLEVVVAKETASDVIATGFDLAKRLRKVAVRAGLCDGFIGNRLMMQYRRAADYMMEDGATPYEIDTALRNFGFAMGPFQVADLAGLDIGWATRKRLAPTRDPNERYIRVADRICEQGWFGQKTGKGYYIYPNGARIGEPNPEVLAIIDQERQQRGINPKSFSEDEIIQRYMTGMINEGANIVLEGVALRPLDVDMVKVFGYGFPRFRGGPMKYADMIGLENVLANIQQHAKEDSNYWKPSPLLSDLVSKGKNFESLNETI